MRNSLIILFCFITLPCLAGAEELRFGIMKQHPYGFYKDQKPQGYLYEIAQKVLDHAGFEGEPRIFPHQRLHVELKAGAHQCTFFATTAYVVENYNVYEGIGKTIEAVILPRGGLELNRYEDLRNLRIAVPRGVFIDPRFDKDDHLNKMPTLDYKSSMKMLLRQRVDAVVGAMDSLLFNMKELGMSQDLISKPLVFHSFEMVLACRKEGVDIKIIERLNQSIIQLKKEGVFKKIIAKYLGSAF